MANKILAIPDIHGRHDRLTALLKKIDMNTVKRIIFMGDYIDRGPDSKAVIDTLRSLKTTYSDKVVLLLGNHEDMCVKAYTHLGEARDLWYMNGGLATKKSYGGAVPDEVILWMASLPLQYNEDDFFFSHAPQRDGSKLTKNDLIWTCGHPPWIKVPTGSKTGVCGHIHDLPESVGEPRFYDDYIYCDTGCGCASFAPLVAVDVKERTYITDGND